MICVPGPVAADDPDDEQRHVHDPKPSMEQDPEDQKVEPLVDQLEREEQNRANDPHATTYLYPTKDSTVPGCPRNPDVAIRF